MLSPLRHLSSLEIFCLISFFFFFFNMYVFFLCLSHASTKSNTFEVPNQEDSSALFTLHAKKSVISVRTFHSLIMRA